MALKIKVHEAVSQEIELFSNNYGSVVMIPGSNGVFAFYPLDADGRNDDCTYYFTMVHNGIRTGGWHYGRGSDESEFTLGATWTASEDAEIEDFHDEEYAQYILNLLKKCIVKSVDSWKF